MTSAVGHGGAVASHAAGGAWCVMVKEISAGAKMIFFSTVNGVVEDCDVPCYRPLISGDGSWESGSDGATSGGDEVASWMADSVQSDYDLPIPLGRH